MMYTGYMTREEFGLNLFDTIRTISGIMTIRQMMNGVVYREQPEKLPGLTTRYHEAKTRLAGLLPLLTDEEMQQILERYPDVVSM